MEPLTLQIKNSSDLPLPAYQTIGSAGFDFLAAITDQVIIEPGKQAIIPTGIHIAVPVGYELQVRGRSGLAANHGVGLTNGIGTIDSDYRGEISVILRNYGQVSFTVSRGDRIAQGVIAQCRQAKWEAVDELDQTTRGSGGFGSTGS